MGDIQDGKVTMTEWMDYFCNPQINPNVFRIREYLHEQASWQLLEKTINVIVQLDEDKSGKLEYGEFTKFGDLIGLNDEETELLFFSMDKNHI